MAAYSNQRFPDAATAFVGSRQPASRQDYGKFRGFAPGKEESSRDAERSTALHANSARYGHVLDTANMRQVIKIIGAP